VLPGVFQPGGQVVEGVPPSDVVHEEGASRAPVVRPGDGPKRLLPSRVPDLELDLFPLDVDHSGAKLDSDGQVMNWLETFVGKLEQQARFTDTCITDDDVLEQVGVRHGSRIFSAIKKI